MKTKKEITRLLQILDETYPWTDRCFLHYETPWQLMIATILSAQCTDDRVNLVTASLFTQYPTLASFADADLPALEQAVQQTGFFRMKALHIQQSAARLIEVYGGEMPSDMESLTTLPGVGRKTANVVRSHVFHLPSVTVDTHVKRISFKLGLTKHTDPEKIEYDLMAVLPKDHWIPFNQQIITHGRRVCTARAPRCEGCPLRKECAAQQ